MSSSTTKAAAGTHATKMTNGNGTSVLFGRPAFRPSRTTFRIVHPGDEAVATRT